MPIKFTKEATPMVMDNAIVSELLNRLEAAGKPDVYQEAQDALMASVEKHGYLHGDELIFPENIALFVKASK